MQARFRSQGSGQHARPGVPRPAGPVRVRGAPAGDARGAARHGRPGHGRPRARRAGARPAVPRRAPRAMTPPGPSRSAPAGPPDALDDGDRHRRTTRARLPARPRRRALATPAAALRARPRSSTRTRHRPLAEMVARRPLVRRPRPGDPGRLAGPDVVRSGDAATPLPARRRGHGRHASHLADRTDSGGLPRLDRARLPPAARAPADRAARWATTAFR